MTGYSSDDINKFLWPVRIGSGVFPNDMPGERDFISGGGFDVGPAGSPALLNCVAYKLCYYKFGQMPTEYGKPPGYDRARGRCVETFRKLRKSCGTFRNLTNIACIMYCLLATCLYIVCALFDREIGNKNIELTTMEEAFTSEHWIVRIYKVLKRYA